MKRWIRTIWSDLINLFYPNLCLLCETPLVKGEECLCTECLGHLPYVDRGTGKGNPVEHLLIDRERMRSAGAFLIFEQGGNVQKLIHSLKYYGNRELAYLLGKLAAKELQAKESPLCAADMILPVPLHPRKEKKRGYNQSEWIARGMASVLNKPVCTTAVARIKEVDSQTGKTGYNRWVNVESIFSVPDPAVLAGKHILLVDDVVTSGSTAGACIDRLSEVEDIVISFFALSLAKH